MKADKIVRSLDLTTTCIRFLGILAGIMGICSLASMGVW